MDSQLWKQITNNYFKEKNYNFEKKSMRQKFPYKNNTKNKKINK